MITFLSKIYGYGAADQAFVAGMLGGEGLEPHGGDLTISTHTIVTLELRAVDYETHEFVLTVDYSFKENAPTTGSSSSRPVIHFCGIRSRLPVGFLSTRPGSFQINRCSTHR